MKALIILSLILFTKNAIAQPTNAVYLYDGTGDSWHISIVDYPGTKISFNEYSERIDTSENHRGAHVTMFTFQVSGVIRNRAITLKFDKPVNSCELRCPNGIFHATNNKENTEYKFFINQIKAKEFSFVMYSKEPIFTRIDEANRHVTLK
jgi:hypothetical protein